MKPRFFKTAEAFRAWLERNQSTVSELWVGFYKKAAGRKGMTYPEAVDEALCFGWIDGIIRRIDAESYMHRFSPRRPRSIWSNVNVGHVERLTAAGRMRPPGLAAFAARSAARTGVYSFEDRRLEKLSPELERRFRANAVAWRFFTSQPPGYRRIMIHVVMSAKRPETRERRLSRIVALSAAGKRLDPMAPSASKGG